MDCVAIDARVVDAKAGSSRLTHGRAGVEEGVVPDAAGVNAELRAGNMGGREGGIGLRGQDGIAGSRDNFDGDRNLCKGNKYVGLPALTRDGRKGRGYAVVHSE